MQDFLSTLVERGFVNQCTGQEALSVLSKSNTIKPYIGFDLTATSLHVGSLIQLMVLRWARRAGIRPLVLLGSFTSRVGDPTGRIEARPMLSSKALNDNIAGIQKTITHVLGHDEVIHWRDNHDWLSQLSFADFLFNMGPAFSINRMLAMDSIKTRLEANDHMGMVEFFLPDVAGDGFSLVA